MGRGSPSSSSWSDLTRSHFLGFTESSRPGSRAWRVVSPCRLVPTGQGVSRDGGLGERVPRCPRGQPREEQQAFSHSPALLCPPHQDFDLSSAQDAFPPHAHLARSHPRIVRLSLPYLTSSSPRKPSCSPQSPALGRPFLGSSFCSRPDCWKWLHQAQDGDRGTTVLWKGPSLPQAGAAGAGGGVPGKVCVWGLDTINKAGPPGVSAWGSMMSVPHSLIDVYGQGGLDLGGPWSPAGGHFFLPHSGGPAPTLAASPERAE